MLRTYRTGSCPTRAAATRSTFSALGCRVQLLELRQVGPGLVRPPVYIPGDLGKSLIERFQQLRIVRADSPADLTAFPNGCLRVQPQAIDDLHPKSGDPVITYGGRQQPGGR